MNQLTKAQDYASLLLPSDNSEVVRKFEAAYVEQQFRHYLALKVPVVDITTWFHKAQITGANPVLNQIFLIPRNVKVKRNGREEWETVGTVVFSYTFIELKAQQSGQYEGVITETGPDDYFDPILGQAKKMLRSRATVSRNGHKFTFTAWWDEYVQTNQYGVNAQWKGKPHMMLEKCAKAGALRAAFPEWLAGAYAEEEMGAIEKDDSAIEAQFSLNDQIDKAEKIQENIQKKLESAEDMDKISGTIDLIKSEMSTLTEGADLTAKGKAMKEHLGVSRFDDLNKKTLAELELILGKVKAINIEKIGRANKKAETTAKATTPNDSKEQKEDLRNKKPTFTLT